MPKVHILYNVDGRFYAVAPAAPDAPPLRECAMWLSIDKYPLPLSAQWRRPSLTCAFVMPGRNYFRIGTIDPQRSSAPKLVSADDPMVKDYCDASWWTPGLEEAWIEIDGMKEALAEATKLQPRREKHHG